MPSLRKRLSALIPLRYRKPADNLGSLAVSEPALNERFYACDCDKDGVFVRLVHATSSICADNIHINGLQLRVTADTIRDYLRRVAPDDQRSVDRLIDGWQRPGAGDLLIRNRLIAEAENKLCFLSLRSPQHLNHAAQNSREDGGEIFRAARLALARELKRTISPLPGDPVSVVVICKFYLERIAHGVYEIPNMKAFRLTVNGEVIGGLNQHETEFSTTNPVLPGKLQIVTLDEFEHLRLARISANAERRLIAANEQPNDR